MGRENLVGNSGEKPQKPSNLAGGDLIASIPQDPRVAALNQVRAGIRFTYIRPLMTLPIDANFDEAISAANQQIAERSKKLTKPLPEISELETALLRRAHDQRKLLARIKGPDGPVE